VGAYLPTLWAATTITLISLALGLRGAFETDLRNRWILGSVVFFLSLRSMFISPVFPTAIVRALGSAASGAADVVIRAAKAGRALQVVVTKIRCARKAMASDNLRLLRLNKHDHMW